MMTYRFSPWENPHDVTLRSPLKKAKVCRRQRWGAKKKEELGAKGKDFEWKINELGTLHVRCVTEEREREKQIDDIHQRTSEKERERNVNEWLWINKTEREAPANARTNMNTTLDSSSPEKYPSFRAQLTLNNLKASLSLSLFLRFLSLSYII